MSLSRGDLEWLHGWMVHPSPMTVVDGSQAREKLARMEAAQAVRVYRYDPPDDVSEGRSYFCLTPRGQCELAIAMSKTMRLQRGSARWD